MRTKITQSPSIAARFIEHGELVAFPTETVYGLGASIFNETAIRRIFEVKGRPRDNPLIAHVSDISQLETIVSEIPPFARKLIDRFFPGPLTLVLPKSRTVSPLVTAELNTIGVRMPDHRLAQQFLRACRVPVVAPSANISGRPSPTTWRAVQADLDGRIGCILRGDQTRVGLESTVVDCTGKFPVVLRAGAVTLEDLQKVIPETRLADDITDETPKSPGQKHRHYSPSAHVVIVHYPQLTVPDNDSAFIGLNSPANPEIFRKILICRDVDDYAHSLFKFFRECDDAQINTIFCQDVPRKGLGLALMDRLERAAH